MYIYICKHTDYQSVVQHPLVGFSSLEHIVLSEAGAPVSSKG